MSQEKCSSDWIVEMALHDMECFKYNNRPTDGLIVRE